MIKKCLRHRAIVAGLFILLLLLSMILFSPFTSDPTAINLQNSLQPPSLKHPFGTDNLGRDLLARVFHAAQIDLAISLLIVSLSVIIGIFIGLISGFFKKVDKITIGIIDVFLALPELILALVIVGALGPGLFNSALALVVLGWIKYARVVRGSVLSIKERQFVEMARAAGLSDFGLIIKHILPNVLSPVVTIAMLHLGHAVLSLAALGFLGLGAQPPTPEWGTMLNEGRVYLRVAWWWSVFPGLAIVLTVFSFTLLGDGLKDILNPKARHEL